MTKKSNRLVLTVAIVVAVILGGRFAWDQFYHTYRFRMTVEVETPQGIRTGSSVMEVYAYKTFAVLPDEGKADVGIKGEAVAVDLPSGTLFALIGNTEDGSSLQYTATKALDPSFTGGADGFLAATPELSKRSALGQTGNIPSNSYPRLVRFREIKDPKTVELVDPNKLAASFGKGVKLKSITVEVTDDAVTTGIKKILPKPPFIRPFVYHGETSSTLNLYDGKKVSEAIDTEAFSTGVQ